MKKIALYFVLLAASFVAVGCATADPYAKKLYIRSMEQAVESNNNGLDAECRELGVKAKLYAKLEAEQNHSSTWAQYYKKPGCVQKFERTGWNAEDAPIVLPMNLSFTPDEAAKMTNEQMCDNMVRRAVASKTVAAVLNDRSGSTSYYDDATGYCYFVEREKSRRRIRWNNLFYRIAPRVGYGYGFGYGRYEYRQSGNYSRTSRYGGTISGGCDFCGPRRRALIRRLNK